MILFLLGAALAAIGAAALAVLPFRLAGRKVPRALPPIAVGFAVILFVIWNDYAWFPRASAALPEKVEVVETLAEKHAARPWTFIVPRVHRFTALDRTSIRRDEAPAGYAIAEVLFVQRAQPILRARQIFDCPGVRRADLTEGTEFAENGMPQEVVWVKVEPEDPLFVAICSESGR
jgi:hypothetical protein